MSEDLSLISHSSKCHSWSIGSTAPNKVLKDETQKHTSSISGESLANWEEDEEWGIKEPVKDPFPKPVIKRDVGPDPLQASACGPKFC